MHKVALGPFGLSGENELQSINPPINLLVLISSLEGSVDIDTPLIPGRNNICSH
jgi:hypothetical protein